MENKIKELEEKLLRKEQELQEAMDCYVQLDLQRIKEYNELVDRYTVKEQECEFSNLRIIQLQETLSQYETDLSTKDCIIETCKAQYKELKAENEILKEKITISSNSDKRTLKIIQTLTEIKSLCYEQDLNEDFFACEILQKISDVE